MALYGVCLRAQLSSIEAQWQQFIDFSKPMGEAVTEGRERLGY